MEALVLIRKVLIISPVYLCTRRRGDQRFEIEEHLSGASCNGKFYVSYDNILIKIFSSKII